MYTRIYKINGPLRSGNPRASDKKSHQTVRYKDLFFFLLSTELYFLIARFLEAGPCREVSNVSRFSQLDYSLFRRLFNIIIVERETQQYACTFRR